MNIPDTTTPVLVLNCKLGGLGIFRSLGRLGVPVYGVDADPRAPGFFSRYCRRRWVRRPDEDGGRRYLDFLLGLGRDLGRKALLIPTSDELAVVVAENAEELSRFFLFPRNDPALVKGLMSKEGMYGLARKHHVPTPATLFPRTLEDVRRHAESVRFPVMLKGILGNRLQIRTGKKMVLVHNPGDLVDQFRKLNDPELPNLMIQEYIPGTDDQIFIFNGYFDDHSDCLVGFTGHKIRQYPVHVGCASLGVCTWNRAVYDLTTSFMKALGYRGILDIGYRLDPRDGTYKVLDINPRIGQAFRLFLGRDGMDVARALYLDATGQALAPVVPREGRKWLIEDYDLESTYHYFREGSLNLGAWVRSFRGVQEGAWFSLQDPLPFAQMLNNLAAKLGRWVVKRVCRWVPGWAGKKALVPGMP